MAVIAYQREFVNITGSVSGALLLSQIIYWGKTVKRRFYKTDQELRYELGLSKNVFESEKRKLKSLNLPFIKIHRKAVPATTFYEVDEGQLSYFMENFAENIQIPDFQETSFLKSNKQVSLNSGNKFPENQETIYRTEITHKITSDINTSISCLIVADAPESDLENEINVKEEKVNQLAQTSSKQINSPHREGKQQDDTEKFEEWYSHYPRKEAKKPALRAFRKAIKLVDLESLVESTKAYTLSVQGKDKQYIALPATWLNQERWEDFKNTIDKSKIENSNVTYLKRVTNYISEEDKEILEHLHESLGIVKFCSWIYNTDFHFIGFEGNKGVFEVNTAFTRDYLLREDKEFKQKIKLSLKEVFGEDNSIEIIVKGQKDIHKWKEEMMENIVNTEFYFKRHG